LKSSVDESRSDEARINTSLKVRERDNLEWDEEAN